MVYLDGTDIATIGRPVNCDYGTPDTTPYVLIY